MQCFVRKLQTRDKKIKNIRLVTLSANKVRSEKGACLSLTSVPLTFAHIDGLKISTDKSTLFSKLEVRIITDAPRNIDACNVNGMFLVQFHVDLPSTFGGQVNVTVLSCQTCNSCRFCI